jgi:hypothetical protein
MATKEALDELQEIVDKIKSGEYLHRQASFHTKTDGVTANNIAGFHLDTGCNTAHCIAGWKIVRDLKRLGVDPYYRIQFEMLNEDFRIDFTASTMAEIRGADLNLYLDIKRGEEWGYAQGQWNLTPDEASAIFRVNATLEDIEDELQKMKEKYLTPPPLPNETIPVPANVL